MRGSEEQEVNLCAVSAVLVLKLVGVTVLDASPCVEGNEVVLGYEFLKSGLVCLPDGACDGRHPAPNMRGLSNTGGVHISSD